MLKLISTLAALSLGAAAFAQTTISPNAQQVQLLAPQLVAFSGSIVNFDSLVSGLTQGLPVTLATAGADGAVQIVTFAPGTTLSVAEAARALEAARQSLISRGIAAPTAQQLAIALMGGTLPTQLGTTQVIGVVSGNAGATPIRVRTGAGGSVTFTPPGGPLSAFEVNEALQLASLLLAQQGILDPTPEQLRVALLGGNLGTVAIQGVLQGRLRNTSDSRLVGTSNSRVVGTSNSLVAGTSNTPPAVSAAGGLVVPGTASRVTPIFGSAAR